MSNARPSRLTAFADPPAPKAERVAAHNFRRLGARVLMTNEWGRHAVVAEGDYYRYLSGGVTNEEPLGSELLEKGFFRDQLDFRAQAEAVIRRSLLDWPGPNVHTVVVTLRCNFRCLYCHASVVDPSRTDMDMTPATARAVVDMIFQSPNPSLMIEFQGGEPLLNWPVVKFIAEYARKKNQVHKRALHLGLISNFSLLDDEKVDFLIDRGVSFCTSLDGPAELHNKNRQFLGGNSHESTLAGLRKVLDRGAKGAKVDRPNAICTVTKFSLDKHKEIIDQVVGLGLERIQLGPLDPIGFARKSWGTIGYGSREFLEFYAKALDYLIELNQNGVKAYEKMAMILLVRILQGRHWRFPNADGLCRLAYNHDGAVYTCEEGRLLANEGDDFFRIGSVHGGRYPELMEHRTLKASLLAAETGSQPMCSQCAYRALCTVQPVYNHRTQDSVWGQMPSNGWCEKMMGIFDILFERLEVPASRKVLESWLEYRER